MSEPLDLEAIKARAEAATPGPWEVNGSPHHRHIAIVGRHYITKPDKAGRSARNEEVAAFVAASRTDVPALVAEVERLRDERDELLAALNSVPSGPSDRDVADAFYAGRDSHPRP